MKIPQVNSRPWRGSLLSSLHSFAPLMALLIPSSTSAQGDDPTPPVDVVKLIFIHHSSGENWLSVGTVV